MAHHLESSPLAKTKGQAEALRRFVMAQRWYQARASAPTGLQVMGVATVAPGVSWNLVQVRYADGSDCLYNVPLCICRRNEVPEKAIVVADLDASSSPGSPQSLVLADAAHHAGARAALLMAVLTQQRIDTSDGSWQAHFYDGAVPVSARGSRVLEGEQSNTSIIYPDGGIMKLFRTLQTGPNPDVEMTQYLSVEQNLSCVPRLFGSLSFMAGTGSNRRRYDAAMLQSFVGGARDGWRAAMAELSPWLHTLPAGPLPFLDAAAQLGATTRMMHEALAQPHSDPAFAPQTLGAADVVSYIGNAIAQCDSSCAYLQAARATLPSRVGKAADRLLEAHRSAKAHTGLHLVERLIPDMPQVAPHGTPGLGLRIRHHGDFHLGQVLQRQDGHFVLLDFEGEPLRPVAQRRSLNCPLRDVAGMLRSFAYAAATARSQLQQPTVAQQTASRTWLQTIGDAYLQAYLAAVPQLPRTPSGAPAQLLPEDGAAVQALLRLFSLEKAFYELHYELAHRPDWVMVPLQALLDMVDEQG